MPEALAILAVFAVVVAAYIGAFVTARDPAHRNPVEDLATLRQQQAWLRERLAQAQRENWDDQMIANLAERLAHAEACMAARISADRGA